MNSQLLMTVAAWVSILGVSVPFVIYSLKYLRRVQKESRVNRERFTASIEGLVDVSSTVAMRADVGIYLQTWNLRWHMFALRAQLVLVLVVVVQSLIAVFAVLFVGGWLKYLMLGSGVISIGTSLWSAIQITRSAEAHSEAFLASWDRYVEKHVQRRRRSQPNTALEARSKLRASAQR